MQLITDTCNMIWICTQYKTRIEVESNQIGDSGEDKIFFCHVGNHNNELEDKYINSNYSLDIFTTCSPKTVNTEAAAQLSGKELQQYQDAIKMLPLC